MNSFFAYISSSNTEKISTDFGKKEMWVVVFMEFILRYLTGNT